MKQLEEFVVRDAWFKGLEDWGTAMELIETTAQIVNSTFVSNRKGSYRCIIPDPEYGCLNDGSIGSAVIATQSKIDISQSTFKNNGADYGGALFIEYSIINMIENEFIDNNATMWGGAVCLLFSAITIQTSKFDNNDAIFGGVLYSISSSVTIQLSEFRNNYATTGAVVYSRNSNVTIEGSIFDDNIATPDKEVLCLDSINISLMELSEVSNDTFLNREGYLISYNIFSIFNIKLRVSNSYITYNNSPINTLIYVNNSPNKTASGLIYHITTNSTDLCPEPCLTLSQFVVISKNCIHANTTLVFLPGTHHLTMFTSNLFVSNLYKFSLKSENSTAQIKCEGPGFSTILFSQIQYIHIANLEFIGCGGIRVMNVKEFVVHNTLFRGPEISETLPLKLPIDAALELIETTAQIVNSTFVSNKGGSLRINVRLIPPNSEYLSHDLVGGAIIATHSEVDISQSTFENNAAGTYGGAIYAEEHSIISLNNSLFINNSATNFGGAVCLLSSTVMIEASGFLNNNADQRGGALCSYNSTIVIKGSKFDSNSGTWSGGVLSSHSSTITINESEFHRNNARNGGVLNSYNDSVEIEATDLDNNIAGQYGGVLYTDSSTIKIGSSNFTNNSSPIGAVIYAQGSSMLQYHNSLLIADNSASRYAVVYLTGSEFRGHYSGNAIFSNNLGSLVAFSSNITFIGYAMFVNNQPPHTTIDNFQEGGVITLFQSNTFFYGRCSLKHNLAENGGAIYSTESKLYVKGNVTIAHNTATGNGGGVYLLTSELNCQQKSTFELLNNTATHKGGGIHAISSSIKAASDHIEVCLCFSSPSNYVGARLGFTKNKAEKGGGLSLEANAKLYILKYNYIYRRRYDTNTTIFTANNAKYGGAVYVDDSSNSGTSCTSDTKAECFFQVLALYSRKSKYITTQSMSFSQNNASISGSTLYGGLLDRCAVSQFAEVRNKHPDNEPSQYEGNGVRYFNGVSTPSYYSFDLGEIKLRTNFSVSSNPVQVCLCTNNEHNCTHQSSVDTKKGESFTVSLVAVDQIGQPVNATIHISLGFTESGLAEGQLTAEILAKCTDLMFNVVSLHKSESLTLFASDGPCKNSELSSRTIEIHFLPCSCPIGLQVSGINKTNCTCECHTDISQYVQCDSHSGSFIKQPQSRAWISYINDTNLTGYLVYPNCPFDYCSSTSPPVDLNQPNGADSQCAFNRSSLLCGSCQPGLSLSLGSSRCLPCPSYWPALLITITIAAILAGIALVTLLLVLNMTVAVGTLNGLIFYANVVYSNKSILLPFQGTNFITVFISWLNLELGIDTCFFPGMDTYIKTWQQLAFPGYVILLVVLVIIISSYSSKFSTLIGKKNPVATLSTLILLSYAKFLEVCFNSLSVGILDYPDGSNKMFWLPDATVKYISGKHIPLFIAAVLIFLVGLVYTALLFSWQWLLYLPRWRVFRWSRNPKIQTFIETCHTPYTPKHRYWTGLLLIVRIILYLVGAVNVSNDPTVALTAIIFMMCCIFALSRFMGSRLYKQWLVDVLETFYYLNILCLATFTWYCLGECRNKEAAAYTSVIITFIVLLLIILYHVYTYTTVFSKVKKTKLGIMIGRLLNKTVDPKRKPTYQKTSQPNDDIHRFNELLDIIDRPVNTNDYTVPLTQKPREPTHTVVEVYHPHLEPSDPEKSITQNIPGTCTAEFIQVQVDSVDGQVQTDEVKGNEEFYIEQAISSKESEV